MVDEWARIPSTTMGPAFGATVIVPELGALGGVTMAVHAEEAGAGTTAEADRPAREDHDPGLRGEAPRTHPEAYAETRRREVPRHAPITTITTHWSCLRRPPGNRIWTVSSARASTCNPGRIEVGFPTLGHALPP